jgi:hypothetical protein
MEPEEPENKTEGINATASTWIVRATGTIAGLGAIWGFFGANGSVIDRLLNAVAVGMGLIFILIFIGWLGSSIFMLAASRFSTEEHPFKQGLQFAFVLFLLALFVDGALLGQTFVVRPLLTLLVNGDWETTYYGCPTEWVVIDEGSYCADVW